MEKILNNLPRIIFFSENDEIVASIARTETTDVDREEGIEYDDELGVYREYDEIKYEDEDGLCTDRGYEYWKVKKDSPYNIESPNFQLPKDAIVLDVDDPKIDVNKIIDEYERTFGDEIWEQGF